MERDTLMELSGFDNGKEDEIDLLKIGKMLFERLHYIILCFLLGAIVFNAYSYFMIHPTYQSTAKMYMVAASEDAVINFSDLNIGQALTSDYEELIFSYPVMEKVIKELDLKMDTKTLANMITVNNPENTRVLSITTTSISPKKARDITNTLVDVIRTYLPDTMNTVEPNVAQYGKLEPHKVGPSYFKYTALGGIFGAGIFCLVIFVIYLMDDTIKNSEELEQEFGMVPLTVIPDSDAVSGEVSKKKGGKK